MDDDVALSLYLREPNKGLLLKLVYPFPGRFYGLTYCRLYLRLKLEPLLIKCTLYFILGDNKVNRLFVVLLIIMHSLIHSNFIQVEPIFYRLLHFEVYDVFPVSADNLPDVVTVV